MKTGFCIIFFLVLSGGLFAQTADPIGEYYHFLNENKNATYSGATNMFPLQSAYFQAIPDFGYLNSFEYLDSIRLKFNLTTDENEMLAKNGFVVTERLSYNKTVDALNDIYHKDLPVMVTTDMMLYALHASYDGILKKLEIDLLRPNLIEMLVRLRNSYESLREKYIVYPGMQNSLRDVDIYISIPQNLLGESASPLDSANQETYNLLLSKIESQNFYEMPLFSEHLRKLDFSQFIPRGHYTEVFYSDKGTDSLVNYFKAMMWLGRMDFLLTPPPSAGEAPWSEDDILRMNISSLLLNELVDISGSREILEMNEKVISLMVGSPDNLTPSGLKKIRVDAGIDNLSEMLDPEVYSGFKKILIENPESGQKILSDIFIMDPFSPVPDTLPVSFRLFGQRFIIDSYFMSQLVYDRIVFEDQKIWRPLPSPLDVSFILGNNDALNLLEDEINTYHYASQLSCLRKLTDLYDTAFWQQSLYNSWLSCIRELNIKPDWEGRPFFLSSAAWQHEKLNTQLASWAQLRHDNLLYAKQSYTGSVSCSYPYSYIEPYPGFFKGLFLFANTAGTCFRQLNVSTAIIEYFTKMQSTCGKLSSILEKQIQSVPLSNEEIDFLRNIYQKGTNACGGAIENGWYFDLLFDPGKESVVADVHTQPTDEMGNMVGKVLHVGTGKVNLGIFLANGYAPGNKPMAFVGPVMSYYETVTNDFFRYNDDQWKNEFMQLERPDWTSIYLAGKNGDAQVGGKELPFQKISLAEFSTILQGKTDFFGFPNPANDFINLRNCPVGTALYIYDVRGRLVHQTFKSQNPVNISGLEKGIYILRACEKGKTLTTKIVKE